MGGHVNVTVRKKDGTIIPMGAWTNSLSYWLFSPKFIDNPEVVMNEFIEINKTSPYYTEDAACAPDGYGLVVIDLMKNKILSHQDYTSLQGFFNVRISLDLNLRGNFDPKLKTSDIPFLNLENISKDSEFYKDCLNIYQLFMRRRIVGDIGFYKHLINENKLVSFRKDNYKKFMEMTLKKEKELSNDDWLFFLKMNDSRDSFYMNIDLSPFEVINYDLKDLDRTDGFNQLKEKLIELDFNLTKEDNEAWDLWFLYLDEE